MRYLPLVLLLSFPLAGCKSDTPYVGTWEYEGPPEVGWSKGVGGQLAEDRLHYSLTINPDGSARCTRTWVTDGKPLDNNSIDWSMSWQETSPHHLTFNGSKVPTLLNVNRWDVTGNQLALTVESSNPASSTWTRAAGPYVPPDTARPH